MERRVIQEFIEIYRSEPSLWKVRSSHYNNRAIKQAAYRRMVVKLREVFPTADVEMVKRKINALRTNYRKELRKVEKSREMNRRTGEALYVPSLWYFELFHFIADQESEPPIIDVTGVDFDENMVMTYEGEEEMSDEFDEEVSNPDNRTTSPLFHRWLSDEQLDSKRPRLELNSKPDGQEAFGSYVAAKLREMDRDSRMVSERLIAEVLFRGQMGLLSRSTCLRDDDTPAVQVED